MTILFADADLPVDTAKETWLHGTRIEHRGLWSSTQLVGYSDWPGMAQAVCVERRVTDKRTGETRTQRAYALTSLSPERANAAHRLRLWREHWHIETRLHWVRGCPLGRITFDEDRSTVRVGRLPQMFAAVRNTVIGVARMAGATNTAKACRRYAAQPALALTTLGLATENG